MVSTVTTSTVTTVTTMAGLGVVLGGVAIGTLIVMLCARELATAGERHPVSSLGRSLGVAVIPLVMVFAATVVVNVARVLAS